MLAGPGRLRTGITVAGVLLVAAGTQVIPTLSLPPVTVATVAGALPGVPFDARIEANLERVAAAIVGADPEHARVFQSILDRGRQLLHFDPDANHGRGSWAELIGTIDERTEAVGILVPGSAAYILDENFEKYYQRASDLVEASNGRLAMVIWAAGTFPKGWLQGAMTRYRGPLGRALAIFSQELRAEIERRLGPDSGVRLVVAGHSFGGAVVGTAERYGLDADVVFHIASAGVGDARDPYDYPDPTRPRYSITAPGDLIGFVQGLPAPPGLGHGADPDTFRCVTRLPTGHLPADPTALDELGRPLGDRAGDEIGGISSHSDVFIKHSDAWWQIYRVFTGTAPPPQPCPPPDEHEPVKARVLPLAVPRVVTGSQCRAGGGLRPGGRHRGRSGAVAIQ
ncbi:MAG TPA: hypothetical protein VIL37_01985 [Natronosporangium sp.]